MGIFVDVVDDGVGTGVGAGQKENLQSEPIGKSSPPHLVTFL